MGFGDFFDMGLWKTVIKETVKDLSTDPKFKDQLNKSVAESMDGLKRWNQMNIDKNNQREEDWRQKERLEEEKRQRWLYEQKEEQKNIPERLTKLKELKEAGILTDEEYESKRKELANKL